MAASACHIIAKEIEIAFLRTIAFLDAHIFINNSIDKVLELQYFCCLRYTDMLLDVLFFRSSFWRCFVKMLLLEISQNRLCQSLFFNKVAGLYRPTLLKKRLWYRCFPFNFAEFIRTPFL